jgi:hypothetical protein
MWKVLRPTKVSGRRVRQWVTTEQIKLSDKMAHVLTPWLQEPNNPDFNYLSGFLDGEGWLSKDGSVGFGQLDGPVLQKVLKLLAKYNIAYNGHKSKNGCWKYYFIYQDKYRVLGQCRPVRLLTKTNYLWENKATWNRYTKPAKILNIEYIGRKKVVAIQTSTHTFIANGFLSHNCQMELRLAAHFSQDKNLCQVYKTGGDIHDTTAKAVGCDRRQAKVINFGILYGIGVKALAKNLNATYDDARK